MSTIAVDPKAVAWKAYDQSVLKRYLRHDTWHANVAIPLLCDIDPKNSDELNFEDIVDFVNIRPEDEPDYPCYERITILSENLIYNLEPHALPLRHEIGIALQTISDVRNTKSESVYVDTPDNIGPRLITRSKAHKLLTELYEIFFSNPDHISDPRQDELDAASGNIVNIRMRQQKTPAYYLNWAKSKGIEVKWLEWAKARSLLPKEQSTPASKPDKPITSNERNTLLVIIGALLNQLKIDPSEDGVATPVVHMLEQYGVKIDPKTVRSKLRMIADAKDRRS